jgi:hypothetical protein
VGNPAGTAVEAVGRAAVEAVERTAVEAVGNPAGTAVEAAATAVEAPTPIAAPENESPAPETVTGIIDTVAPDNIRSGTVAADACWAVVAVPMAAEACCAKGAEAIEAAVCGS